MKKITIFGSTGSIGKNTVEILRTNPDKFECFALVAKDSHKTLAKQIDILQPQFAVIENEKNADELREIVNFKKCQILTGREATLEIARQKVDLVVAAIMGFAGLEPTLNAIEAGSNIAIANKESLVCAGEILMNLAKKKKAKIIPIDSEHNAILQVFEAQNFDKIEEIILTASGGPFFNKNVDFEKITVEQALKHPNWSMGAKISIDSATMMNKGLEMIEAYYLFPKIQKNQIKILVHPESIIHGFCNYKDGSSLAMLSLPDMKTPISYALSMQNRLAIKHEKLDLAKIGQLSFFEPDKSRFRALQICENVLQSEGSSLIALNAANEEAVAAFLHKKINFAKITEIIETVLSKTQQKSAKEIAQIKEIDQNSREFAKKIINNLSN